MEKNASPPPHPLPEHKNDEDVTVLALPQKMSARLDILGQMISASPITSSRDGQTSVQMIWEYRAYHPSSSDFQEVAQKNELLGPSRLTLQDLHHGQHSQAGANQFVRGSL
ncbi:unnamed protein product [Peronospora effusa]|nr:unnamed protein product [Peronospora effusa]